MAAHSEVASLLVTSSSPQCSDPSTLWPTQVHVHALCMCESEQLTFADCTDTWTTGREDGEE